MAPKITDLYFLEGGGAMGELIRAKDWSKTPLGAPENWPQSLQTMVSVMLNNPFGMYIAWGKEFTQIYNDGYRPILGETKHPQALGIGTKETFSEIWHIIESMFEDVMKGIPVGFPDFMLPLNRNGFVEECYFDFAYSPIRMENGEVGGVLVTVIETTDKKKNEEVQKEHQNQLEFAIEAAQLGTFDYNPLTNKFTANHRLKEWFGLPPEEEINLNDAINSIAPNDRVRVSDAIAKALDHTSGGSYDIKYSLINPVTNKKIIVHAKGKTWFNEEQMAYRLNGTVEDITKRTKSLQKRIKSQQITRQMVLEAPIGICLLDAATLVSEIVNDRFVEIAGKPYDSIINTYYWDTFAEAKPYYEEALQSVVQTGNPYYANEVALMLIRHGKEENIHVTFVYAPIKDEKGIVQKIAVWVIDNTLQVQAHQKIIESENNLKLMIHQAPIAISILRDWDYKVEIANKHALDLWGRTEEEILNKSIFSSMPELMEQGIKELLDEVTTTGKRFATTELPLQLLRNGSLETVYINFSYEALYDENGVINGVMAIGFDVSQQVLARKKAEETAIQLKAQKRLYEAVTKSTPDLIYVFDLNYRFTYANDALLKMWGRTWEEANGKFLLELGYEPWHAEMHEREIDQIIATKKSIRGEVSFPHATLGKRVYDYILVPVINNEGEVEAIAGTTRDITELKQVEETLKENEKQFKTLANNIQNLAWMADANGAIYWYNERWYEYTGTSLEQMKGWGWQSVHDTEHLPKVLEKWQHSINTGECFEMVFPLKGADGIFRPFLTLVYPLKDDNGNVIRWIGTNTDISKQKEAEDQFRQMAERMPQKIWTSDISGNRTYFNQVMLDYCGLTFEELKDWGWKKIIHPEDWEKTKQLLEHSLKTGEDYENEYRILGKDGKYLWHLGRAIPVKDKQGKIILWIGSKTVVQNQIEHSETLEENLKESNERMQTILQHAPDSIISFDENGRIMSWNAESETIFGWKECEVMGKSLAETIIPKRFYSCNATAMQYFFNDTQKNSNKPIERIVVNSNGCEFPIELKISRLYTNNSFLHISFIRDISIRKKAEETIKNKTNQLLEAQQQAHIGSWEWDIETNKIEWSDELYRIHGLLPQEIAIDYEKYLSFIPYEERDYVNQTVQQAIQDKKSFKIFRKVICPNGNVRILSSTGKVILDANGNVVGMSGTAQDVTEQKKYEQELQVSEERFYKIFDSNPIPMTLSEIKTNEIRYANTLFYNLFGYTKKEVIGNSSIDLHLIDADENNRITNLILELLKEERSLDEIQSLSKPEIENLLLKLKQSEAMQDFEILYTKKNGEKIPVLISFEIIHMGTDSYVVTSYQDMTARNKAEELLRTQNEQLEKMNKELQSFAYISSHDLQEPLRKIQTFASQIMEREAVNLSKSGMDKFERMQKAAFRMQTLIQDLLAYSRTSTQQRIFESIDLSEIVEEIKEDLKEELQLKEAVIEMRDMCEVKVIPFQFRQLLFNLISNALKFSSQKRAPLIKIDCTKATVKDLIDHNIPTDNDYMHISVEDNGIGFDQEYSEKIFLVFQRLHGKDEYAGTGIGLAIVKKIVENHNGFILAKGVPNKGATFHIYIPV
ncbi:PAS domain S-box protein [Flavobacterium sp. UMI-01]|uniref:PAS domain S-box protein n=1 Tax=Flavobacterium sp. UMI-01 TaxID=1441053 RepID=UPI001C7D7977|nr:PAS domain S-box protein [Flavobacterium sp. UMI-01]GIZ08184.1 hypothetical protein FUMI01_09110 [Flavobacterium sp. UMI-01]